MKENCTYVLPISELGIGESLAGKEHVAWHSGAKQSKEDYSDE